MSILLNNIIGLSGITGVVTRVVTNREASHDA